MPQTPRRKVRGRTSVRYSPSSKDHEGEYGVTVRRNLRWPNEAVRARLLQMALSWERNLGAPFPCVRQLLLWHVRDMEVSLRRLHAEVGCKNRRSGVLG